MKSRRQKWFDVFLAVLLCCCVFCWLLRGAVRQNVRDLSLLIAIAESDAPAVHRLLQEGADANATDQEAPSTLAAVLRVWQNRLTHRRPLLQDGVSSALILALTNRTESPLIVRDLLAHNADPNQSLFSTCTPLMYALSTNRMASVHDLLAKGAHVNARSNDGETPLMIACYNGSATEIVQRLIVLGADVNAIDANGTSVLTRAANGRKNCATNIEALVKAGAMVNQHSSRGWTALMVAACRGQENTVRILLDHGADIHFRSVYGQTALQLARRQHAAQVITLLKQAEARQKAK